MSLPDRRRIWHRNGVASRTAGYPFLMSEAMSDVLSNLKDHAPSLPSAKDARDAVKSHLPSLKDLDTSAIADRLPKAHNRKRKLLAMIGGLAAAAAAFGIVRRRRTPETTSASLYTPPLPKP